MTDQKENKQTLDKTKSSVPVSLHPSRDLHVTKAVLSGEAHLFTPSVIMLRRTSAGEEKFKVISGCRQSNTMEEMWRLKRPVKGVREGEKGLSGSGCSAYPKVPWDC